MALLEASGISVAFGGRRAVDKADLTAERGQISGLIGPNGAGKTTMFNALCGLQRTEAGEVRLDGELISDLRPYQRARKGLGRTFQRLETFNLLTVRENVLAGAEFRNRWAGDDADAGLVAAQLIEELSLGDVADERVDGLPTGRARLVEVGRALAGRPRVLLLDEPSSGLNDAETDELAAVLRRLADDGLAVLMVEHDMGLVMGTCDLIHVLDFGEIIAVGDPAVVQADGRVQRAYLGDGGSAAKSTAASHPRIDADLRSPVPMLEVRGLYAGYGDFDVLEDVSFSVADGEVFVLFGPNGAGKTTTLDVIAGLLPASRGTVELCGHNVTGADVSALARAGVCMVPEGRGVFPNLTVAENLWMATHSGADRSRIEEITYSRFPVLSKLRTQLAGTLSGGEQQMLAMARALSTDPALLILDELSMGLAPLIVRDIYERVAEIAAGGVSILVVEQFAHDVLDVADTAAIMLNGSIRRIGSPSDIAEELEAAYLSGATT
ncbi:MAG: ATP-binding cassette domain-containing protein [Acidimicrobiales bacterium]|nr:ATP-binding cassette domain-containing protein [Acidimicrobiales bacterium]